MREQMIMIICLIMSRSYVLYKTSSIGHRLLGGKADGRCLGESQYGEISALSNITSILQNIYDEL